MYEARANWTDGEQFQCVAPSGHAVMVDSDRQSNRAAGPMDLVLIGLCTCTATDVAIILRKKREPFTALQVRAQAERAADPPRVFTRIRLIYSVRGAVARKSVEDAVRLSKEKYCSVSAMLQKTVALTAEIEIKE